MGRKKQGNRPGQRRGDEHPKRKTTSPKGVSSKGNGEQQQRAAASNQPTAVTNQAPQPTQDNQAGRKENGKQFWNRRRVTCAELILGTTIAGSAIVQVVVTGSQWIAMNDQVVEQRKATEEMGKQTAAMTVQNGLTRQQMDDAAREARAILGTMHPALEPGIAIGNRIVCNVILNNAGRRRAIITFVESDTQLLDKGETPVLMLTNLKRKADSGNFNRKSIVEPTQGTTFFSSPQEPLSDVQVTQIEAGDKIIYFAMYSSRFVGIAL